MERIIGSPDPNGYSDNDRLKTLYDISKKLAVFKNVEESFAAIVSCAAESFPLVSAVLIEHWEKVPRTAVWFASGASRATVARALLNAKENYSYMTGASILESSNFLEEFSSEIEFSGYNDALQNDNNVSNNYIVLPLMIDNLPPLGAIQLQGSKSLAEKDLEFVNALTSLVSVALDRYYKTKIERAFNRDEMQKSLEAISTSTGKIKDLEVERGLREDFVSLLTHDLKSPISVILGAGELICKKSSSPEHCLRLGGMIVNQSKKVIKMINDLLDANQIRSGRKLVLNFETISLNSLVNETASELKIVHGDRFEVIADHNIEVSCDESGIKRVLQNLCNNAIKYGSADSSVRIILEETNTNIYMRVHNLGNPIPLEEQKNIFHHFQRSKDALIGHREGWGIGLTLVRGVAEAHGGSVDVRSNEEEGTSFIVSLPKD